ncbi:hypothetical protein BBF96_14175 [Anoxybacter fermentans]|uniref:GH18 domain-containing protein n=1 Tax=Anoxybacter fermentans TaxID=1323375 RepID=A0A3Q9HS49_9FIRM|nr:glycosyl hydrolase family 18 protein [Anoxybacter fermentans]AZR74431.1 hypothetical protein BBF96_14175 [Anoxybacter fermentans]
MKKLTTPIKYRFISITLILSLLLPILLILTVGIAEASYESLFSDKNTFFKALIMLLMAFLLERFLGDQKVVTRPGDPPVSDIPDDSHTPYIPSRRYLSPGEKEVLGYYVNWNTPGSESYPSLQKNAQNIDIVSPFWYTITSTGDIQTKYGGHQTNVSTLTRQQGQLLLPLINNQNSNSSILIDSNIRRKAIDNIVALVQWNNYDGVNIDFEFIPPWSKDGYTTFIRELSQKLHARGKMIIISVFPKVDVSYDLSGAYDYKALAPYIDRLVIMTYDNHWAGGPAGPIAPINWVEENILYALQEVPADKILLGVANYGYDWPLNGGWGKDLAAKKAIDLAERKGALIKWDSEAQVPYFYYTDSLGNKHVVWFESSYSLDFKLQLVNKYNLKGIAIWRLGNEEDRFWSIIKDRLNK